MQSKKCGNAKCNNIVTEISVKTKNLKQYCSNKCKGYSNSITTVEKRKQTNLDRHGVENPFQSVAVKEKIKLTNLLSLGVENPSQSIIVHEKRKQTMLTRHGVEYPLQSSVILDKIKVTNLLKYNVEYQIQSTATKDKIKQSYLINFGVDNPMKSTEIKENIKDKCMLLYGSTNWTNKHISQDTQLKLNDPSWLISQNSTKSMIQISNELNVSIYTIWSRFKLYNIPVKLHQSSFFEHQVKEFVKSIYPNIIENDRTKIKPKELDIYFPDLNKAIECNGEYYHQDEQKEEDKLQMCIAANVELLVIWQKEWDDFREETKIKITEFILSRRNTTSCIAW